MAQMDFPISDSVIALLKSASVLPFRTINTLSPSLNTALSCIEEQYRKEHSIMMQCVSNLRDAWLGMRRNLHSDQLDATADLTHTGASSGLHSASDADYVEVAACVGHAKCIREAELPIDTLDARMQELKAQLASSAVSLAQVASHCSPSPAPSFSFDAFIGSKNPSFLKCASAVDNGMRRRDSKFLRHIFDHYKDGAAGLPVSNLALALNDADAPVIPDSKASSGAIALFDGTSNGHMEFSEFVRSVDMPDELALYFQEKRQPLLADAVRAHVGRGSDQLFRASQLSPSDIQSAYSAVCLSLPKQTESLFEDLRSSFTAQFEIQAATAAAASKFNVVKMACGGVANFHEGLTGRIGMPHLKFKDAMRQEHCDKAGYNVSFTTGNYKITTTPKQEWLYIAGDETGQQAPCPDMGHDRRIRLISELMNLQLAIDAKLTEVEMLAIVLYTGPMFQVYNCILRRFPADQFQLFNDGNNLYSTTIFVLVSAVQKVSRCTRIPEGTLLFRGLGGLIDLPDQFHTADQQGRSGYLDWGMMSTSSDRDVALGYSGVKHRRPKAMVMVIETSSVDRGADISDFSQYPGEKEFLWVPCSFVQRVQPGAGRVEIVDGGLVTFVLVRVNLNLKTETVEELLQKKKSMHITGFEFRVNELRQRLHDVAIAGHANARLKRDKDIQGVFWKKQHSVDGFIEDQVKKVEIVLKKHRARAAEDYCDDAVYRSLVAESLEAASMAQSVLQLWLRDCSRHVHHMEGFSLLILHRSFESFLRLRFTRAATKEDQTAAAIELCKVRNLMSTDANEKNDNGEPPLMSLAASGGSGQDVKLLVAARADPAAVGSNGISAMYRAAEHGHVEVIKSLAQAGANINQAKTDDGASPLFAACQAGHLSVVEVLLALGADVNQSTTNDGSTPLLIASSGDNVSILEALLARGADINQAKTTDGASPLFAACQAGHLSVVEALLAHGACINQARTDIGASPLFIASFFGHFSVVAALLSQSADVNQSRTDNGTTPLCIASENGHTRTVESLLDGGANVNQATTDFGSTPLFAAVFNGHFSVVGVLLARGADVNQARTDNGATPLWIACQKNRSTVVEALLNRGANANKCRTDDGTTPLFIASFLCHSAIVEMLLARDADVNQPSTKNGTPLFISCEAGHTMIVEALLARSADFNQSTTDNGTTPLWIACQKGHVSIVEQLLSRGADCNQATTDSGVAPLFIAVFNGHSSIVELLLARGADVKQATTYNGTTPLFIASQNGHTSIVEALLARGADIDQANTDDGASPLFAACQAGHLSVVEVLLALGADVNKSSKDGVTPLFIASRNGHASIEEVLLNRGADASPLIIASKRAAVHAAAVELHQSSGYVVVNLHRGGGCVTSDYQLQFRSFNTFVADIKLCGHCFYFELEVVDIVGVSQLGVCTQGFEQRVQSMGEGAGDDAWSWAVDGTRLRKWHRGSSEAYSSKWVVGDVIGFKVDMRSVGSATLSASVNGSFAAPNGTAFVDIQAPFLSPAFSGDGRYRVNFGERPFAHAPPGFDYVSVYGFHKQQL